MNTLSFVQVRRLSITLLISITIFGCTPQLDGKYENANGMLSIEFKSNKAYVGSVMGQVEGEYEVKDDKIVVKYDGQNIVLTRNSDGSLDSPMGKMTKK